MLFDTKSQTLYVKRYFMKFLNLAFNHKKHDTLCYWTFLYTKIQTLRKKQDNLRSVFMFKNPDTLHQAIFIEFLEFAEGGGIFTLKNSSLCVTFLYLKNNALCLTFYIQKARHYALYFYMCKKNCTLRYVFISKLYRVQYS